MTIARIKEFITDDSGKLSMGRICIGVVCFGYVGFAGISVWFSSTHAMPDMPMGVAAVVSALYAANKFSPTIPFPRPCDDK